MQDDFIKIIKDKENTIISQRIELAMLGESCNAIVRSILNLKEEIDRESMLEIVEYKEHQKPIDDSIIQISMREYRRLQTLDKGFKNLLKIFRVNNRSLQKGYK